MTIGHGVRRYVCRGQVFVAAFCFALTVGILSENAAAVDGTWNPTGFAGDGTGLWSDTTKWTGGTVANGAGGFANFSTLNITVDSTVSLDSSRTIGRLQFGDTTASNNWFLNDNANPLNVLTLDNTGGTGGPRITVNNQTATISAALAGTNGVTLTGGTGGTGSTLVLSGANTYSGTTTINSATTNQFTVVLQNNTALGTGPVVFDPQLTGTNGARLSLASGVTIPNNITFTTVRSVAGNGAIRTEGDVTATWSGSITKNGNSTSGGEFGGPVGAATTNYLILSGPIINNVTSMPKNDSLISNRSIQVRHGNVRMADTTGTSSGFRIENRNATLQVGATNGIATNSYVNLAGNVGNPGGPPAAVLDLNGFNQRLVGLSNYVGNNAEPSIVTNSSTSSPATLTLTPADPATNPNQAKLVLTAGGNGLGTAAAVISDTDANFPLNLVVNGAAAGIQYLTTPNGSYRGTTTLTNGTLAVSSLSDAGTNSSIGASSVANPATDLVFNGGKLRYVNSGLNSAEATVALGNSTTPSTNRNFTIGNGSSGTIEVDAPGTTLTWSGGSASSTGSLIKGGAGTLILSGTNAHTGGTTVSAGTLQVNGGLATGTVSVASAAKLMGTGTIGGTINAASGSIIAPGTSVGTLTTGGLTANSGSFLDFEFGSGVNDMITVNNSGGLQVNGGNIHLYNEGGITDFSTNGTYTLFNINGGFGGALSNFTVANPVAGKFYSLTNSPASGVQLTIGNATTVNWNGNSSSSWTLGGNWVGGSSPNAIGTSVRFNGNSLTGAASTTINVDGGGKTASGVIFNDDGSSSSFTIAGTDTLTLNNGIAAAAINVNNGSHTISAPISSTNTLSVSFTNGSSLAVSGAIGGAKPLAVSGSGTMTLTGVNSHSSTSITAAAPDSATLNVGTFGGSSTTGTLGSGDVTMSGGGVLNFNRSNAYNFGFGITGSGVGAGSVNQRGTGTTTVTGPINNVTSVNVSAGGLTASSTINQSGGVNVTGGGSLSAGGSIGGAGAVTVNTTGTVALNALNSYTGGTQINGGTVTLNAAGALPNNSALGVDGGTLNLNANNIAVTSFTDTVVGGAIVNNGAAASTSTITYTGAGASDDIYAAVNNGAGGGKIAVVSSIANSQSGNIYTLHFHSAGTFSGGITVNSQSIQADASNAFGTGPISVALNNISTNSSQIFLAPGVSIGNNITIAQGNALPVNGTGTQGVIQQTGPGDGTQDTHVLGTVTINANNFTGGLFRGPDTTGSEFLNIHGAVMTAGTADTVIQRDGRVKYYGGGNYPNFAVNGLTQLGANNGLSTSAVIRVSTFQDGTLDLGGFNQTAVALFTDTASISTVQNSGGNFSTLTLNTSGTNAYSGTINGDINLTIGGNGTQTLTGFNSYAGDTKVQSGTLSITNAYLADAADVLVSTGALFDLNFVGTDTVDALYLGGSPKVGGTVWGGPLSGAPNLSNLLSGTGWLQVTTTGPALGIAGDYNNNGIVDAADYVLWRNFQGTNTVLPNDPTGGTIGATQYNTWKANFGKTPGSGSALGESTNVPEPGTVVLSLLAACGVAAVVRRRKS